MNKNAKPGFWKSCANFIARRWSDLPSGVGNGFDYNRDGDLYGGADAVLRISAAWACVTLLCDVISTLPGGVYKKVGTERVAQTTHPLHVILTVAPNADQTPTQFWGAFLASMLLREGGYAEKILGGDGSVVGLDFLNPDKLSCTTRSDGTKEYRYTENGKVRLIPRSRIWYVPGFSLDGKTGCSAIKYGAHVFGTARAADAVARSTFWRGLMPTTWFSYPKTLKDNQRTDAREAIEKLSGATNAGKPIILENGMEVGTIGINPNDAQLLESRAFSVEEICSWFRVQPFMIGRASQGQTNWGTGIEQQMIGFVTFTLAPWLKRLEQAMRKDLLSPAERATTYIKFSLDGLLRGDSAARAAFYSSALQNGWLNRAQVAQLEDKPAPPGGDVYTVQSNLVPLDKVGTASAITINNAPAADVTAVQQAALNGAQVMSLQAIVAAVATGQLPPETAAAMLAAAFPLLTPQQIDNILNPLQDFEPAPPEEPNNA